ncbi:MAG TPA: DUF3667 domain-containing protein [Rhizomicrobium sp.]|nr:DUF3667 domain-containing protein [Rhizomicrobium sp.]
MSDLEAILETGAAAGVELAASALAERGQPPGKCPNCGSPMIGPFCAVCGQERDTHRRSIWSLLGDLFEDIISFDSRILRTGVALMAEPGEIAMAFREGRPRRYVPALRLYFFVSLIFFVILNITGLAIMQFEVVATPQTIVGKGGKYFLVNPDKTPDVGEPKLIPVPKVEALSPGTHYGLSLRAHFFSPVGAYHSDLPPEARAKIAKYATRGMGGVDDPTGVWITERVYGTFNRLVADPAALNASLTAWVPRVLFLLLPLFALLLMLFYIRRRKQFYFVDHLIFSLNMHSFVFIALIVAVGVAQVFDSGLVALAAIAAMGLYLLIAMKRFYMQNWFWTGLKFLSVAFIYTVFFLLPALGGAIVASIFWT